MCRIKAFAAGALLATALSSAAAAANLNFEHVMNIGAAGNGPGQFQYVEDFAFSKDGHLLATDASHGYVQAFDKASGKFIARFGGKGDDDANLEKPEGIAVDPDGNIYVADYTSGFIKKYAADFKWLKTFSGYGNERGQTIEAEFMDIRNGRLYVPDVGNARVNVFSLDGQPITDFGNKGAETLINPEAAKFNGAGELYVSDLKNDRVVVFDADGKFLRSVGKSGAGAGELKAPAGIAFDRDDNLYVAELGNDRIQVFDKAGRSIAMWGKKGPGDGEFGNVHGIIVDKASGFIYVADTANKRIQVFQPQRQETVGKARR
jgi:DNA-binding beta-propeller fold protein YncE